MQIHDTRQDRINLVHNNKRYGLTKIDEVVLFLLISSFYFRGTKHICMYVHNQNSYCLAVGVIGEWVAILDILLKSKEADGLALFYLQPCCSDDSTCHYAPQIG